MTFVLRMTVSNTVSLEEFKAESSVRAQFKADGAHLTPWALNVSFLYRQRFLA